MQNDKNAKGLIFNIVHGSFVDGYGIRTTIFLKGCPLRCIWCCNPEGQAFQPQLKVTAAHCNGCGECIGLCDKQAITLVDQRVRIDRQKCDDCGACTQRCWLGALELFGTWYTAEEMYGLIKRDAPFYASSGGGLTIGGGEATCYPEFCLALMELCHSDGINVAVDTCGYVQSPLGLEVLKQADLLLFDVKGIDEERHLRNTGVSNRLILDNLRMLNRLRKHIIVRVPLIPGYNDTEAELRAIAELLSGLQSVERVDLIAFHEFGKVKYEQLGMEYGVNASSIPDDRQEEIKALFESHGLNTQLGG